VSSASEAAAFSAEPSIPPNTRKSLKFNTPCHGNVFHLQLPRSGLFWPGKLF
jgi:hypothetical protein